MEPTGERPTIETARQVGRERIDRVLNFIAPIMAPEVLLEMGKNATQDKVDAAKEKVDALKERVEVRATEIRDTFVEKVTAAYDRFESDFNKKRDKAIAVGKEVARRAKIVGLTPVAAAEHVWEKVSNIRAGFREAIADAKDRKIEKYNAKIREWEVQRDDHRKEAAKSREIHAKRNNVRTQLAGLKTTG